MSKSFRASSRLFICQMTAGDKIMNSKEMFEVLDRVRTWDMEMRIDLARRILETVTPRDL